MPNNLLFLETDDGIFLIKRIDEGPIIIGTGSLQDQYCLKEIGSKVGGPVNERKEYHGSLQIVLDGEKLYLTVINHDKVKLTIIVNKIYLAHKTKLSFLIEEPPPM